MPGRSPTKPPESALESSVEKYTFGLFAPISAKSESLKDEMENLQSKLAVVASFVGFITLTNCNLKVKTI
jgi:hypothetical protein